MFGARLVNSGPVQLTFLYNVDFRIDSAQFNPMLFWTILFPVFETRLGSIVPDLALFSLKLVRNWTNSSGIELGLGYSNHFSVNWASLVSSESGLVKLR